MKSKFLWMLVTMDEYELPIAVADSSYELAKMIGVSRDTICSSMSICRKNGWKCRYVKVKVLEDD